MVPAITAIWHWSSTQGTHQNKKADINWQPFCLSCVGNDANAIKSAPIEQCQNGASTDRCIMLILYVGHMSKLDKWFTSDILL